MSTRFSCQRWRDRWHQFRPAGEPFDPSRHGVEALADREAKVFVCRHHYAGSYPAARFRVGLLRKEAPWSAARLAGVAVFSVPMNPRAAPAHTGVAAAEAVELGRFVLLDEVEGNAETWFLARALALLPVALPAVRAILSYSDPVPRTTAAGVARFPGHVGTIYQAANAAYLGRAGRRTLFLAPDGTTVSDRALSKLRLDERGAGYAYALLRRHGAPERRPGEAGRAYVDRALREGPFRPLKHQGNHVYAFALDRGLRRRLQGKGQAYPKLIPPLFASTVATSNHVEKSDMGGRP